MNLKTKAISGAKWTTSSTIIVSLLQFFQVSVLARYLAPTDFGLMAIMMVVIGFSQAFSDMGISNAIIQKQKINHTQLSTLYWLNIICGVAVFIVVQSIAPLIADIYDEPHITNLIRLLSLVFIFVSIGNQYRILCQKELNFKAMEIINVTTALIGFLVAVTAAKNDYGVKSLIYAMLVQTGLSSILYLLLGIKFYHRPSLKFEFSQVRSFLSFGLYQMGERSVNFISNNSDKLLIGKFVGIDVVGFYNLAWQLVIFPITKIHPIINKIAFPIYSKVQHDLNKLDSYYTLTVKILSIASLPFLTFLIFFPQEIVEVVFGQGWNKTAEIIPVLAVVGILKSVGNPGGAIILALGRADVGFWWNAFWSIITVISLSISLYMWPTAQVAVNTLLLLYLTIGLLWHFIISKITKVHYRPIILFMSKLSSIVFLIGFIGFTIINLISIASPLLTILIASSICGTLYIAYLSIFEKKVFSSIRNK